METERLQSASLSLYEEQPMFWGESQDLNPSLFTGLATGFQNLLQGHLALIPIFYRKKKYNQASTLRQALRVLK